MKKLPLSQNENVVVQQADKETLVYNLLTNKAYCLNETSAIVFNACDGRTSFDDLKRKYKFTDDIIYFALGELKRENLISEDIGEHFAGLSRREVIRRVGLGSMIALPFILSLVVPMGAMAASCFGMSAPGAVFGAACIPNTTCAGVSATCCAPGSLFATNNCSSCSGTLVNCADVVAGAPCAQCTCQCS